ncbi:MAG: hypothetical protein KBA31_14695 [Alphaproteobacteria bacterium]|nr:hypothetical protein [Alphaproteobacteria bacterium]
MIDNRFDRQIVSGDLFSELLASMRRAAFAGAAKHPQFGTATGVASGATTDDRVQDQPRRSGSPH